MFIALLMIFISLTLVQKLYEFDKIEIKGKWSDKYSIDRINPYFYVLIAFLLINFILLGSIDFENDDAYKMASVPTLTSLIIQFYYHVVRDRRNSLLFVNNVWMSKNLDVDRFRNGDMIHEAKTTEEWMQAYHAKQPAWCFFENDPINDTQYGKLYNYYAVNDPRGLAPTGWRIPNRKDWRNFFAFSKIEHNTSLYQRGLLLNTTGLIITHISHSSYSDISMSIKQNEIISNIKRSILNGCRDHEGRFKSLHRLETSSYYRFETIGEFWTIRGGLFGSIICVREARSRSDRDEIELEIFNSNGAGPTGYGGIPSGGFAVRCISEQ
jgi:uncharacterized protein (TIGR02145 family)